MVPSQCALFDNEAFTNILQIWQYFLAYSTIASRRGTATDYMITLVKNINSTHRVDGIPNQFGLSAAPGSEQAQAQDVDFSHRCNEVKVAGL